VSGRRWLPAILAVVAVSPACVSSSSTEPDCSRTDDSIFILAAQAVPTAVKLPCLGTLPAGWRFAGSLIKTDLVRLWLNSDIAGIHAVEVDLIARCDTSEAFEVPPSPDEIGSTVYEEPATPPPHFSGRRYVVFSGGCIRTTYRFSAGPSSLAIQADSAIGLIPRSLVVRHVDDEFELPLCGAGAPPCTS
jgi:hypothetical protein